VELEWAVSDRVIVISPALEIIVSRNDVVDLIVAHGPGAKIYQAGDNGNCNQDNDQGGLDIPETRGCRSAFSHVG
jgi:hypothetical protein